MISQPMQREVLERVIVLESKRMETDLVRWLVQARLQRNLELLLACRAVVLTITRMGVHADACVLCQAQREGCVLPCEDANAQTIARRSAKAWTIAHYYAGETMTALRARVLDVAGLLPLKR